MARNKRDSHSARQETKQSGSDCEDCVDSAIRLLVTIVNSPFEIHLRRENAESLRLISRVWHSPLQMLVLLSHRVTAISVYGM